MKPVVEDDPILMYNFEDEDEEEEGRAGTVEPNRRLEEQIEDLRRELSEKQQELISCKEDMIKMRSAAQNLFSGIEESSKKTLRGIVSVSEHKTVEEDASYFQSYAHYGIHYEM